MALVSRLGLVPGIIAAGETDPPGSGPPDDLAPRERQEVGEQPEVRERVNSPALQIAASRLRKVAIAMVGYMLDREPGS
jgi:hypothetical protein